MFLTFCDEISKPGPTQSKSIRCGWSSRKPYSVQSFPSSLAEKTDPLQPTVSAPSIRCCRPATYLNLRLISVKAKSGSNIVSQSRNRTFDAVRGPLLFDSLCSKSLFLVSALEWIHPFLFVGERTGIGRSSIQTYDMSKGQPNDTTNGERLALFQQSAYSDKRK